MTFKIEAGIPLPPQQRIAGRTSPYPLRQMKQGDSFFVPGGKKIIQRVQSATSSFGKKHNIRFALRVVKDEGVRVWHMGPRVAASMSIAAE